MNRMPKIALIVLLCLSPCWPQVAKEANKDYQTPEGRRRVASTLDDPHRQEALKANELIARLGIKPSSVVADVGTGTGFMLPYFSEAVGSAGRVIAEDIQQDFLDKAAARIQSQHLSNVSTVLGGDKNPNLPEGQLDLVFMLDVYHHFDYPSDMLAHFSRALKAEGRLAVADYYRHRRGPQDGDMSGHIRADRDEVIREIESNGFRLESKSDNGSQQYLLIFAKK
ncbi:MAG: methyltransferase domain-containing protein [Acidobacteria bacterium]|nr:methyltransferase domain-containing protein [Acidobacteriota bacterium]